MGVLIRTAVDSDLVQVIDIWKQGIKKTFVDMHLNDIIIQKFTDNFMNRKEHEFWVAELQGKPIGFQSFLPLSRNPLKSEYMLESSTYIDWSFINSGIGYKLLAYALEGLRSTSTKSVITFISSNSIPAIKIAERLGFQKVGLVPPISTSPEKMIFLKPLI